MIKMYMGDCLNIMDRLIGEGIKVDMVLCDPPFATTNCKWDSLIPFDEMWDKLYKITNPNSAIVLFGSEPFSSALRMSNIKNFKYSWYWEKEKGSGFLNAKRQPLRAIEDINVFYKKQCIYNPQMREGKPYRTTNNPSKDKGIHNNYKPIETVNEGTRYPLNVLKFKKETGLHPTQKPIDLLEYLIKTYTNEGQTVLDFTSGSNSTGVACFNLNRNYIGIELDQTYFNIGVNRIYDLKNSK